MTGGDLMTGGEGSLMTGGEGSVMTGGDDWFGDD